MGLSLDEFRSYLLHPEARQSLGIQLSDAEAQQVVSDPQASQTWYAYWQSISPQAPAVEVAAPETAAPEAAGPENPPAEQAPAPHEAAQPAYGATPPAASDQPAPQADFAAAPPAYQSTPESTGDAYAVTAAYGASPAGAAPYGAVAEETPGKKKRTGLWVALSIVAAVLIAAIVVVVIAFTTARHWTKTDVAEKPETFHSEEYETGVYNVTDDGVSPCVVNQDWTECADAMEAQYAGACADVELTVMAQALCNRHRTEIDRMRGLDQEGMFVSALGSFGSLTKTPETATREVSNDDYEPAVTHEAVCYLDFIGECE